MYKICFIFENKLKYFKLMFAKMTFEGHLMVISDINIILRIL